MKNMVVAVAVLVGSFGIMAQTQFEFWGQYRARWEYRNNKDFLSSSYDEYAFVNSRLRLGVKARIDERFEVGVTLQDARIFGRTGAEVADDVPLEGVRFTATNSLGLESIDLNEAYLKIALDGQWQVILGRQRLAYGEHRLLGTFDWSNVSNSFDGLKVRYNSGALQLDGLAFMLRESQVLESTVEKPTGINAGSYLFGVYGTYQQKDLDIALYSLLMADSKRLGGGIGFEPYLEEGKNRNISAAIQAATTEPREARIWALGARLGGKIKAGTIVPWWTAEFVYQTGTAWQYDLAAFAGFARVGLTLAALPLKPKVFVEYNLASGTDSADRQSGKRTTFYNFFPTNHIHYGYGDLFSWKNMKGLRLHLEGQIIEQPNWSVKLLVDWWKFNLFTPEDYWYHAGQGIFVPTVGPYSSDDAGQELDFTVMVRWHGLKWMSGIAWFMPGSLLTSMNREDGMLWGFSQIVLGF